MMMHIRTHLGRIEDRMAPSVPQYKSGARRRQRVWDGICFVAIVDATRFPDRGPAGVSKQRRRTKDKQTRLE